MKLASLLALAAAGTPQWSPPAVLSPCAAAAAPRVVFPSDSPTHATGAGVVVWSASPQCPGGAGARVAPLAAGEEPGASIIPRTAAGQPLAPLGALLASGAPRGQIVIAGSSPGAPTANGLEIQGAAGGPFSALTPVEGSAAPMALATAYLGDVALAATPAGGADAGALRIHVERFYSHSFARNVSANAAGGGQVHALTLALDYRGEALAVWAHGGAIYTCLAPSSGPAHALQRIAPVGADPHIAALLSDDNRAIVAWSDRRGGETSVYVERSAVGGRFSAPHLLERFQDPDELPAPRSSPSLVRLSSESVMLAWAGAAAGHWVVRTAPVDLAGVGATTTIAAPGQDALLADLAAGPSGDALLLWTEPSMDGSGVTAMQRQALFAAPSVDALQPRTAFGEPAQITPAVPLSGAEVAFDPDSDRAIAVWRGTAGAIEYSIRAGRTAR